MCVCNAHEVRRRRGGVGQAQKCKALECVGVGCEACWGVFVGAFFLCVVLAGVVQGTARLRCVLDTVHDAAGGSLNLSETDPKFQMKQMEKYQICEINELRAIEPSKKKKRRWSVP